MAPGIWQHSPVPVPGAGVYRRITGLQLCAVAGRGLQQPPVYPDGSHSRPPHARPAPLGRQHVDRGRRAPHDPGLFVRRLQKTARSHLDGRRHLVAVDAGLWADRLPAPLGQPCLLGYRRGDEYCRPSPVAGSVSHESVGRERQHWSGHICAVLRVARPAASTGNHTVNLLPYLPGSKTRGGACARR